jgi:hypothetical protein
MLGGQRDAVRFAQSMERAEVSKQTQWAGRPVLHDVHGHATVADEQYIAKSSEPDASSCINK